MTNTAWVISSAWEELEVWRRATEWTRETWRWTIAANASSDPFSLNRFNNSPSLSLISIVKCAPNPIGDILFSRGTAMGLVLGVVLRDNVREIARGWTLVIVV